MRGDREESHDGRHSLVTTLSSTDRLRGLRVLVGNTPMLVVELSVDGGEPRRVYAKAESLNMRAASRTERRCTSFAARMNRVSSSRVV